MTLAIAFRPAGATRARALVLQYLAGVPGNRLATPRGLPITRTSPGGTPAMSLAWTHLCQRHQTLDEVPLEKSPVRTKDFSIVGCLLSLAAMGRC